MRWGRRKPSNAIITQWEHLTLAIFNLKKTTKITCDGLRPISNMSNISFAMGIFSNQNYSNSTVQSPFSMVKVSLSWNKYSFDKGVWYHSTSIKLFYFNDNLLRIAQWVLAFKHGGRADSKNIYIYIYIY